MDSNENITDLPFFSKLFIFFFVYFFYRELIIPFLRIGINQNSYINLIFIIFYLIFIFTFRIFISHASISCKKLTIKDIIIDTKYLLVANIPTILITLIMISTTNFDSHLNQSSVERLISADSVLKLVASFILIAIVVPITEELLFRGFFKKLFSNLSLKYQYILSAGLFSMNHLSNNIFSSVIFFIIGLVLYKAYSRNNNLADSIFVHCLNNSITFIITNI